MIVTFALTIMSFLALSGLRNSDREALTASRSRNTTRTLAAADAGLQLALGRLAQSPPDLNAFDVDLADGANVQSRGRSDTAPQDLKEVGSSQSGQEGYGMAIGGSIGGINRIYLVATTATTGGSTVELEAKLTRSGVDEIGY